MGKTKLALAFSLLTASSLASATGWDLGTLASGSVTPVSNAAFSTFSDDFTFKVDSSTLDITGGTSIAQFFSYTGPSGVVTIPTLSGINSFAFQVFDVTSSSFIGTVGGVGKDVKLTGLSLTDQYKLEVTGTPTSTAQALYTVVLGAGAAVSGGVTSAAPEAGEWAMMLLGLPMVGWMVRRKQDVVVAAA